MTTHILTTWIQTHTSAP